MGASISGSLVTGQNNVILGAAADLDSDRSNCIVIGPNAITSASIVAPISFSNTPNNLASATSASSWAASALPALPLGYIVLSYNGTPIKLPYYNL